jgi:RNA polymerase sigma factor (sigma-70 family)
LWHGATARAGGCNEPNRYLCRFKNLVEAVAIIGDMSEVTEILSQIEAGDEQAGEKLLPLVYEELRKLAAAKLAHEQPGQTLQATALVHEAYLRLVGGQSKEPGTEKPKNKKATEGQESGDRSQEPKQWNSRGHFIGAAAEAMRRILVDNARRKKCIKHGGAQQRVEIEIADSSSCQGSLDLLAVDEALEKFSQLEPLKAELVKLRFFAGLTMPEAAEALGISLATAERHWTYARTWLFAAMADSGEAVRPITKK